MVETFGTPKLPKEEGRARADRTAEPQAAGTRVWLVKLQLEAGRLGVFPLCLGAWRKVGRVLCVAARVWVCTLILRVL